MKGRAVYEALLRGPATLEQVRARTGMSANAVHVAVGRLRRQGYRVTNRTPLGRGRRAVWVLETREPLPERRCEWPGCDTVLRRENRDTFCSLHRTLTNDRALGAACRETGGRPCRV